ncbi:hypothetical protein HKX48_009133 [Thoreauomyces humboldtii]|nr:hypothetical protein HKX48_009133 [Thoreauomyces humboldtii]
MTPNSVTYVISGASRGLGLALCRHILTVSPDAFIFAGVRNVNSEEIQALAREHDGRMSLFKLDLLDHVGVKKAAEELAKHPAAARGIDVLVNNAAATVGSRDDVLAENALEALSSDVQVNLIGTAAVTLAFLPLLRAGARKTIWTITTRTATISDALNSHAFAASYTASKTGLSMWTVKLSRAVAPEGFTVLALSPGWFKSNMGGPQAQRSSKDAAKDTYNVLSTKTVADHATFWDYTGEKLSW